MKAEAFDTLNINIWINNFGKYWKLMKYVGDKIKEKGKGLQWDVTTNDSKSGMSFCDSKGLSLN